MRSEGNNNVVYTLDPDNSRFMPNNQGIMRETQSIMQIVKNEGFLEDLKHRLLGEKLNRETKQWEPISLRELPEDTNERVDFVKEELIFECNKCGIKNTQIMLRCPKCGEQLNQNMACSKDGLINEPLTNCVTCGNEVIKFVKLIKKYKNDSAQMSKEGANELIGLLNIINNPIRNLGSELEHYKLRRQRALLSSIGYLIDENWRRYGINESVTEGVKASIWDYISSLFSLTVTDKPKSLIENLSSVVQEYKQTIDGDGSNKKRGMLP